MGEATKHHPLNERSFVIDLKSLSTLARAKQSVVFAYGFMFAFTVFTLFLAFNPSTNSSSSTWLSNFFSGITNSKSTLDSPSGGIQLPSNLSYSFPSSQHFHNSAPLVPSQTNSTKSQNTLILDQAPIFNKEHPSFVKNQTIINDFLDKVGTLKPNLTISGPSISPIESKNQTHNHDLPNKVEVLKPNLTIIVATESPVQVKNQTHNIVDMRDEVVDLKPNQTAVKTHKTPVTNRTVNSEPKSSLKGKDITRNGDNRIEENGVVTNLTTSLSQKHKNQPISGTPAKPDTEEMIKSLMNCDLFDGEWVRDDSYPLYQPGSCSLIDQQFSCFLNGRPDNGFQQFKWKPHGCILPRLNGSHMLELLRGKRLVFVGDSLNRNMWESLVCIFKNSVKDQTNVLEVFNRNSFRFAPPFSFLFKDYNCTLEFFVSPFLVQESVIRRKNGSKQETLRLDKMGFSADKYRDADIIIFNTGHWWTHAKTSEGKDYYQEGKQVHPQLDVVEAFRKALKTWARWVDANVNPSKTVVFFRGYSASHFSGGKWNSGGQCHNETEPINNKAYLLPYPLKMRVLEKVMRNMTTPVSYMNITRMTDYRKDGHPSMYRKPHMSSAEKKITLQNQDCSHWCLPGVPDAWNEILYAELLLKHSKNQQQRLL